MKTFLLLGVSLFIIACAHNKDSKQRAYTDLKQYLNNEQIYQNVLIPEGQFVHAFCPELVPYLKRSLQKKDLIELSSLLKQSLDIKLTPRGFAKAAERDLADGEKDETNYDAIWVRDSGWIYFNFLETNQFDKAKKLLLALWDYYATDSQQVRFKQVIKNPTLATKGTMNVPHIRFDGNSSDLSDVMRDGQPEQWNHRQNDAHGIFLLSLASAFKHNILSLKDLNSKRLTTLKMFPTYFDKIKFEQFKDAGAWEEINKTNTSSIAMVVKSIEQWESVLKNNSKLKNKINWNQKQLKSLKNRGYAQIKRNLYWGGESANHSPKSLEFRQEDAALFNLFLPMPLKELNYKDKQYALTILEKLIRPFGVLRYKNDSYQSGNYWIEAPGLEKKKDGPSATGDSSSEDDFTKRFSTFIPYSEAQWFFDSKLSMIHIQMHKDTNDSQAKSIHKHFALVHFKRALAQATGHREHKPILAADGKEVQKLQFTESINTIVIDGKRFYLPSPITPLNWAKASMGMNLNRLKLIF